MDDTFYDNSENLTNVIKYANKAYQNTLDEGTFFTLSHSTLSTLDILPKLRPDGTIDTLGSSGSTSRTNATIYAVLNKCRTKPGQNLLALWLQNPLKCPKKVNLRLEIVHHLMENVELRSICHDDHLRKIPDLIRVAFKIKREKCSLNDLMKVYNTCTIVQTMCKTFGHLVEMSETNPPESINNLFDWAQSSLKNLGDFMKLVEDSIDTDKVDDSGEYVVRPECDEMIARITLDINNITSRARKELSQVAEDIGLEAGKSVKLETDAEKGFAFKVTKQNEQAVRGNSDYEQLSLVKKDGYRFTSRTLTRLSNKYVNAKQEYQDAAKNIIEEVISRAVMYDGEILEMAMAITMIDVFVALATAASQNNYCKPLILDSSAGKVNLDQVRHPCVENQPDIENYVPNDLTMSRDEKRFYIITGPNMGGKSTYIKSVATAIIMAQCGSLVPARDATISIVDGVFTRIGAGDKQMEGISTFMEEMMDMATILKEANEYSMVIIDELGRGTSTFDGFGLAWSISKQLASQIKCYTLFATHFLELTELEREIEAVGNLHVKALCQDEKLIMLFNVDKGICDESYGINVARYTRFPQRVIDAAKEKLRQFEEVPGFSSKREVREFINEYVREHSSKASL